MWLFSFYTFVYHASPDSLFMVVCLVILLQLALFACCAVTGGVLVLRGDRGLGPGLLIGWAAGIIALVVGTVLIDQSVPVDPTAAAANMAHHGLAVASTFVRRERARAGIITAPMPTPSIRPTDLVFPLSHLCWHAVDQPDATIWTTIDREVAVQLTVPRAWHEHAA